MIRKDPTLELVKAIPEPLKLKQVEVEDIDIRYPHYLFQVQLRPGDTCVISGVGDTQMDLTTMEGKCFSRLNLAESYGYTRFKHIVIEREIGTAIASE